MCRYKCPKCGTDMDFVAAPWQLECPNCGSIGIFYENRRVEIVNRDY